MACLYRQQAQLKLQVRVKEALQLSWQKLLRRLRLHQPKHSAPAQSTVKGLIEDVAAVDTTVNANGAR